jgi:hypothetical protein
VLRLPPPRSTARREVLAAGALLILAMCALSVPAHLLSRLGGDVLDTEGHAITSTVSLLLGTACLTGSVWACVRALNGTLAERPVTVLLALLVAAEFGAVYRTVLQLAVLHRFYLAEEAGSSIAGRYWGITILLVATAAFVMPLLLAAANLLPHTHGPARYKSAITAIAGRRSCLLIPLAASVLIVGVCAAAPVSLRTALGYSSPTLGGSRLVFNLSLLDTTIWQAFQRIAFLPLLVGMWEGMESARAAYRVASTNGVCRTLVGLDYRLLAIVGMLAGLALALLEHAPLFIPGALALAGVVAFASGGMLRRLAAVPALASTGRLVGVSEDWREAAPIGRVLLVLGAPALIPLAVDLWRGIEGPFRFPADADGYIHYWSVAGLARVPAVSVAGIFAHGTDRLALYSVVLIGLFLVGAFVNVVLLRDNAKGLGRLMWVLVPLAAIAVALAPIVTAASHPSATVMLGAAAIPALLLMDQSPARNEMIATYVLALTLLAGWAYVIWNSTWLPPFTLLAATIIWRFALDAGTLNELEDQVRLRRVAGFLALALLGLGMLTLDHSSHDDPLQSVGFAEVTDKIAVAVVAPVWLIHYAVRQLLARVRSAPAGQADAAG